MVLVLDHDLMQTAAKVVSYQIALTMVLLPACVHEKLNIIFDPVS